MPVNQRAASAYESNATGSKWSSGVDDPRRTPSSGLERAGVDMAGRGGEFDSAWRAGVDEGQGNYEDGIDGDRWLSGMSSASDWNIG